jgi:hypothetical protein
VDLKRERRPTRKAAAHEDVDQLPAETTLVERATVRFRTRREAEQAANDAAAKARTTSPRTTVDSRESFGDYANRWYVEQDLAPSTMQNTTGISRSICGRRSSDSPVRTSGMLT